ncbi:Gfo/Idh/MocA family oxidoreductase [Bradyrhizobium japonicum]|uniref:Gfo/Idh/MocA family oxidoreductase n=1 Tax=Bradyrhizobium japonicum TaxID=375 RepID=UPI0020A19E72|nr:Gfo/Idh/MocA family oxidoreductase [Bradyrhizobium japonicum]MCP1781673.1 putative dehydrogenase [Bradyrhizobium japonicum]MCP1955336.1 putative dehydrogenase [Bradyrhizobium japonicum]
MKFILDPFETKANNWRLLEHIQFFSREDIAHRCLFVKDLCPLAGKRVILVNVAGLLNSTSSASAMAMKISIVGGGRWARTIAAVLGTMAGRSDSIIVHSPRNFEGIEAWIGERRLGDRIRAARAWPSFGAGRDRPDAVVIANRAEDHFAAAAAALRAGIPVLVEKPVCLLRSRIEDLCKIADASGTVFGASHVFLFARYFQIYAGSVASLGQLDSLRLIWTDGVSDVRHGEAKSYDPAVTIFDDVLPHIVPIIGQLTFRDLSLVSLDVQRGGATLVVEARSEGRPVSLTLARNDNGRRRQIEIVTEAGPAALDFTTEPGFIDTPQTRENGDPLWDSAPRPLATMLSAFTAAANGAALDPRLSPRGAIAAAGFAGVIRGRYFAHQAEWLEKRLGAALDPSLHYAVTELSRDTDGDAVTAAWATMDSGARLKAFLAQSPLRSYAGYDQ